jgi:type III secretion protein D
MKSLRILTGHHAGAQLMLSHRQQRIGNDEQADIQITDWQHAEVNLVNKEGDSIMWTTATAEGAQVGTQPMPAPLPMPDFMPQRFGDVVLCVGPTDAVWPSDISLLSALMQVPALAASGSRRMLRRLWAAGSGVVVVSVGAGVLSLLYSSPGEGAKPRPALPEQVVQALAPADAARLKVQSEGASLTVEGLLDNGTDVARVRSALQAFEGQILHRYSAASDVVRTIAEAAGSAHVQVQHQGGGVFLVSGHAADLEQLLGTLQRVAADLNAKVNRIDVQVTQDPGKKRVTASAVYMDKTLQYTQSRDGTRHFSVVESEADVAGFVAPEPNSLTTPTGVLVSLVRPTTAKRRP